MPNGWWLNGNARAYNLAHARKIEIIKHPNGPPPNAAIEITWRGGKRVIVTSTNTWDTAVECLNAMLIDAGITEPTPVAPTYRPPRPDVIPDARTRPLTSRPDPGIPERRSSWWQLSRRR